MTLYKELNTSIDKIKDAPIATDRKKILTNLAVYIQQKIEQTKQIRLNFICTHNSRRSHLTQVWAQTMAFYFNIKNVFCYSGGTEATAVYPMVLETLQDAGFKIAKISESANPVYAIKFADNEAPIIAFSKIMDHFFNPKNSFAAIMTCSQADEACPFVPGAEKRIPLTYEDPKKFDFSPLEKEKYTERSLQIASEMYFVFSLLKSN